MDRESLRLKIIRDSKRGLKRIRQLIADTDSWNDNNTYGDFIDIGKAQLIGICEHLELTIEAAERGDEYLPACNISMEANDAQ